MANETSFYRIDRQRILSATTQEYRAFLKEAGYGDLDSCSYLGVSKGILKIDPNVRAAAGNIYIEGNDNDYLVKITQPEGRSIVQCLGGKLLTTGLMFNVFVPYITELASQGNTEAQTTLNEMKKKAEWLDDLVLGKSKIKIGTKEKRITLVKNKDGKFDRNNINDFGYPQAIKDQGEFYYWPPRGNELATIRGRNGSDLSLNLEWVPGIRIYHLGVRVTNFPT